MSAEKYNEFTENIYEFDDPFRDIKFNITGIDPALNFIDRNKEKLGVALLVPLAATACNYSPTEKINLSTNIPTIIGTVSGIAAMVEEIAEKDPNKNFGRKISAIGFKGVAGYLAGHAISHNTLEGGKWISQNNISETVALAGSAYIFARETSLRQLKEGVSKIFSGLASGVNKITEGSSVHREEYRNKLTEKALKETVNLNKAIKLLQEAGYNNNDVAGLLINRGWSDKDVKSRLNIR